MTRCVSLVFACCYCCCYCFFSQVCDHRATTTGKHKPCQACTHTTNSAALYSVYEHDVHQHHCYTNPCATITGCLQSHVIGWLRLAAMSVSAARWQQPHTERHGGSITDMRLRVCVRLLDCVCVRKSVTHIGSSRPQQASTPHGVDTDEVAVEG